LAWSSGRRSGGCMRSRGSRSGDQPAVWLASQDGSAGVDGGGAAAVRAAGGGVEAGSVQGLDLRAACGRIRGSSRSGCGRWPARSAMSGGSRSSMTVCGEVRPRFVVKRTFQGTIYRPGELAQCDLWEPREAGASHQAHGPGRADGRGEAEDAAVARDDARCGPPPGVPSGGAAAGVGRSQRLLDRLPIRRPPGAAAGLATHVTGVVLGTGELACRHQRVFRGRMHDRRSGASDRARARSRATTAPA